MTGSFLQANGRIPPDPVAFRWHCRGCALGSGRARKPAAAAPIGRFCVRCRRQSLRIIHGLLCVSCYNRQREREIGRNRKGTAPIELERLQPLQHYHLLVDGRPSPIEIDAVDGVEAVLTAARQAPGRPVLIVPGAA